MGGGRAGRITVLVLLTPAMLFLGALVFYPLVASTIRSLYDATGQNFIGLQNYEAMLRNVRMRQAVINNFYWVIAYPVAVTGIGLAFAVLSERIRWRTIFKTLIFLPLVISILAGGVIWRLVFQQDTGVGLMNALLSPVAEAIRPPGPYPGAVTTAEAAQVAEDAAVLLPVEVGPDGGEALIGLTRIRPGEVPAEAEEAAVSAPTPGTLVGTVWRDTRPGDDQPGVVEEGEVGMPGIPLALLAEDGSVVARASSQADGSFRFEGVDPGSYQVQVLGEVFRGPWEGIQWLGPTGLTRFGPHLATMAAIIAQSWIFMGFAMVTIGAGLAALPRELLEAARVDGASEWQVFRQVTVPLLKPVLIVVFITLVIAALKVFDIIFALVPGSVQPQANVIALEQWRVAFTGLGDKGLGSAIAVLLFLLVMPVLALNVRRFRLEET